MVSKELDEFDMYCTGRIYVFIQDMKQMSTLGISIFVQIWSYFFPRKKYVSNITV